MQELYKKFGLDENTQSFVGHAVALWLDDDYQKLPALTTIERINLYKDSLFQYNGGSPYIYPRYGLGELPQAFARLAAIYGGTYMLDKPIDEIVYGADGKIAGVKSQGEVAKCKFVVGDPSYFSTKVKKSGRVIRTICVLNHPIPNTSKEHSLQIILPQRELKRKSDIYIMCISGDHNVVPKGKYMAIVSTNIETGNPEAELKPALDLLGAIEYQFSSVTDLYEPTEDGTRDGVYISSSYDATSHFETVSEDVLHIYKRITGKDMDLTPMKQPEEEEQ
jgi:Rab GDP dissociation inhibitor